jgi:hypothetical protein
MILTFPLKPFEIRTHNGVITMKSMKTGEHRTFRIRTMKQDAKFLPGKRLVELLHGPDNESDYRSFGMIGDDGRVYLWKKHQGQTFYVWVASALQSPERYLDRVEFSFEGRCRRCNRLLSDPDSVASGIGPTCSGIE